MKYELLRTLSVNAGRTIAYQSLLRQMWARRDTGDYRTVRAFVKKLLQKLGDASASPTYIFTVRQAGYRVARQNDA